MQLLLSSVYGLFLFLLLNPVGIAVAKPFAYERGKCDLSISEVIEGLAKASLRRLSQPPRRVSQASLLHYDLYTPLNPQERQLLRTGDKKMMKNSNFNAKWPVRISVHGWTGMSSSCSNAAIKDAYLARGNFNVIILDWSQQAIDIAYYRVSKQLKSIARSLMKFLRFLHDQTGMSYEQVYLVGHSAGSHICGLTGKLMWPDRLGAIIALDPAGLTQLELGPEERLAPNDANYVESIHTDLRLLGNPKADQLSQAAFFANWGRGQPHCPNATATELDLACDHFSAIFYFAESVRRPHNFPAMRCESLRSALTATCGCHKNSNNNNNNRKGAICPGDVFMGGEPAIPKRGIYYLSTRHAPPFGTADGLVHMRPPIPSTILETSARRRSSFFF